MRKLHSFDYPQPPTVVCKMEARSEYVRVAHTFSHVLAPIRMLGRCSSTKLLRRSSVGSLLRVRCCCWLGLRVSPSLLEITGGLPPSACAAARARARAGAGAGARADRRRLVEVVVVRQLEAPAGGVQDGRRGLGLRQREAPGARLRREGDGWDGEGESRVYQLEKFTTLFFF